MNEPIAQHVASVAMESNGGAPPAAQSSADPPTPNTDGIWYASYPPRVPHDIDVTQYQSVAHFFDECTTQFRGRTAFVSVGCEMTYDTLARREGLTLGAVKARLHRARPLLRARVGGAIEGRRIAA